MRADNTGTEEADPAAPKAPLAGSDAVDTEMAKDTSNVAVIVQTNLPAAAADATSQDKPGVSDATVSLLCQ